MQLQGPMRVVSQEGGNEGRTGVKEKKRKTRKGGREFGGSILAPS